MDRCKLYSINIFIFKEKENKEIDNYIKNNNINLLSDYYKVLKDNIDEKSKNELEEYVWINYLRFYKNRRFVKKEVFDYVDIIYIGIHVIMLLLILVR